MIFASKCADIALKKICFASGTSYENLKTDQALEFSAWNQRSILSLDGLETEGKSVDEICQDNKAAKFLDWIYSKYKFISSCKEQATLPSVASGIWTDKKTPEISVCRTEISIDTALEFLDWKK